MPAFDSKKIQQILYIVFLTGAAILLFSRFDPAPKKETVTEQPKPVEDDLELRLQRILKTVEGVGEVRVVINYGTSVTKQIAKDRTEETDENRKRFEEKVVLDNSGEPLVLRESSREIRGVLISAQGGGSAEVKAKLISAAMALLGVDAHKIEVLKMRS